MSAISYEGEIWCKNCGTISHTDEQKCDCTEYVEGGVSDFEPYDKRPYEFIAELRAEIIRLLPKGEKSKYIYDVERRMYEQEGGVA